jgi:hypothetical protein
LKQSNAVETATTKGVDNGVPAISPKVSYAETAGTLKPVSSTKIIINPPILITASGHRFDGPLKKPLPNDIEQFYSTNRKIVEVAKKGPCNQELLGGGCSKPAAECSYSHAELSTGDMEALRWITRRQACQSKLGCRKPWCFYGHKGA